MVDLADERDDVAPRLAPEAVVKAFTGIDRERRRALGVERAQPRESGAHLFDRGLPPDHPDSVGRLPNPGDVLIEDAHVRSTVSAPRSATRRRCRGRAAP